MKLLLRSYLASLRERDELDAILPDLLSELGFTVYSRPKRGTAQAGVDVAAVGKDETGERKLYLFSVKQGDLTRQSWDGATPQALRPSLNEILDNYIPNKVPRNYQGLKIVICLVFGGDMQEQVRAAVNGYLKKHTTEKISFEEWNGDKLAGLLLQGILREEIMPKPLRSHFQKAVALVDEPEIAYQHFARLVRELCTGTTEPKAVVRTARQLYIALWVLFVWARDIDNVEAPYRASELVLLNIWNLLRPFVGKKSSAAGKAIDTVLAYSIELHITIASGFLERKILPHIAAQDAIAMAVQTRSAVDVNLKLFDVLGRIALTGLWAHWLIKRDLDEKRAVIAQNQLTGWVAMGYQLINSNGALFLPLSDEQAIEIALFLVFVGTINGSWADAGVWLHEMTERLAFSVKTHGHYPCVFTEYRDLIAHPRERTDEYREEATSGSILIPLLAPFLFALEDWPSLERLAGLKANELQHCTLQLWLPDMSTE
jgi:hypothetical protein